jgi:hypothetical protein
VCSITSAFPATQGKTLFHDHLQFSPAIALHSARRMPNPARMEKCGIALIPQPLSQQASAPFIFIF